MVVPLVDRLTSLVGVKGPDGRHGCSGEVVVEHLEVVEGSLALRISQGSAGGECYGSVAWHRFVEFLLASNRKETCNDDGFAKTENTVYIICQIILSSMYNILKVCISTRNGQSVNE